MPQKLNIYWDSCIWISFLMLEKRHDPKEVEGVFEAARMVNENEVLLITSQYVRTELSDYILGDKIEIFDRICQRRNVHFRRGDNRSDKLAVEILDYYNHLHRQQGRKMTQTDANHLALAIHYKVDSFYTFDEGKRRCGPQGKGINILALSGNVAGYNLLIRKPPPPAQISMNTYWNYLKG